MLSQQSGITFTGCGICGAFVKDRDVLDTIDVPAMTHKLKHRGPNGEGLNMIDHIWFGHRRLSILDLSPQGSQPMIRGTYIMVYNGEIYNCFELRDELIALGYSFYSGTDTEILLNGYIEWGPSVLDKLNGMFAFAIYDTKSKNLFAARDRLGIKPFYYYNKNGVFLFSSEVESLIQAKCFEPKINKEVLIEQLLVSSYMAEINKTIIEDVVVLKPGHYLNIDLSFEIDVQEYWGFPDVDEEREYNEDEIMAELSPIIKDSIKSRLLSDVPISSFISGGIDSSIIVKSVSIESQDPITAFTTKYLEDPRDADYEHSKILIESLHVPVTHEVVEVSLQNFTFEDIEKISEISYVMDDPRVYPLFLNYKSVRENDFTVILNGQGADELCGGYVETPHFRILTQGIKDGMTPVELFDILMETSFFSEEILSQKEKYNNIVVENLTGQHPDTDISVFRYLTKNSLQRILINEDFMSMRNSIEARVPYLDHRFVEACLKIPMNEHVGVLGKKYLRRYAKEIDIPEEIHARPKQHFPHPSQEPLKINLLKILKSRSEEIENSEILNFVFGDNLKRLDDIGADDLWVMLQLFIIENKIRDSQS
eukprot:TRINITY_DN3741_c0_g1_i1.p1 TRINITY_DN3741_c0_g1~~TRINITY_DN3741_c0_g1_i1.p1  ORF type:complete len:596 (+),score=137.78 TRINITY_DN3741_c0_g1_i1:100-1887(+)